MDRDWNERPFARPPDPNAVRMEEADALERARGANTDAPASALLVRYRDVAAVNPSLAASAQVHPDRLVWVVTVHADVMTRGTLALPPQLAHGYSLVVDAETGGVPDFGWGVEAVLDG